MRVLVVDDSRAMRMLVKHALRQAGHEADVIEAADGAQALESLANGEFDVVLSDWNMPNVTGLELLQAARAAGYVKRFVLVTSEWVPEAREQASEAGADALVTKPFTADQIAAALRTP